MRKENNIGYKLKTNSFVDFDKHLKESDFVFLSAPFGFGKTTYINDFIESQEESGEFSFFHLYPVHYSVNRNEDVFELIKYDLLFEILKRDRTNDEVSINYSKQIKGILQKNVDAVLLSFLEKIPEVGKSIKELVQIFNKVKKEIFELYEKEFETSELNSFITRIENTKGSVFENDIITAYINNKLKEIKGDEVKKKCVLILDDLDRIEPEHIFRLLNVFSANFDSTEYSINKFGIDKVVVVADYYNIKSIYHHKYGKDSDFEGYVNKFYSKEIYFLTFYDAVKSLFKEDYDLYEYGDVEFPSLKINLLTLLFNNKQISFRQIRKISKINFNREKDLFEVVNDIVIVFNEDYKDLLKSCTKVSVQKDRTINENFWSNLLNSIIGYYYNNGQDKIENNREKLGHTNGKYTYKLHNEKKVVFDNDESEIYKVRVHTSIRKTIVWKEFLYFLNNNYKNE